MKAMKTLAELAVEMTKPVATSVACTSCPATVPSLTVAKAAGWKRFRFGVLRYFMCPMCLKCVDSNTGTSAVEIPLEES